MGPESSPLFSIVHKVRETQYSSLVCAHRGDSQNAPENTMAAFKAAIEADSELIEMDIRECADGEIVVFHDGKLERTTNGVGEVKKHTLKELQKLDAGSWFGPAFAEEKIPSFDEFLELVKGRTVPMIEVKDRIATAPNVGPLMIEKLKDHQMLDQVIVIARSKARLAALAKIAPDVSYSIVSFTGFQARSLTKLKNLAGLDHYWKSLSPKLIKDVRDAGLFLTPWTINKREDMMRCLALGVECVLTDAPYILRDAIEEYEVERVSQMIEAGVDELSEVELESIDKDELLHSEEDDD
jgi:glycerophosphoryl diester phosphodiesterase